MRENITNRSLQIVLLFYIITISNIGFAITINISAPSYSSQLISWSKKTDYITNSSTVIDEQTIDIYGNTQLNGEFDKIELTELSIGRTHGILYVDTATKNYTIFFPEDTLIDSSSLKKSQIQLIFIDIPKNDINKLVLDFNLYYDYFLYGDTTKLIRMARHDEEFQDSLNEFKIFVSDRYSSKKIKYLHNYIRYEIALLEQMAHQSKGDLYRTYLYNTYLKRHSIKYENNAYMKFFNLFYFETFRLGDDQSYKQIQFSINQLNDYEKLDNILASIPYFYSEKIRELAIIKGLYDSFSSNEFVEENILKLLEHICLNSQWQVHKTISKKCVVELLKFKIGEDCPDFDLKNQNYELIDLAYCKNKYTYINFFATWNHRSLQEMEIIKKLNENYDFINFISIILDKQNEKYESYIKRNSEFKWDICQASNIDLIIKDFSLDHLPAYILIDPKGKIAQYPAYPPSPLYNNQSIDVTFFNLQKNNTVKTPFGIGGKN